MDGIKEKFSVIDILAHLEKPGIDFVLANALQNDLEYLEHYGKGHLDGGHSGRYPWGSGDNPNQHEGGDFLDRVSELRKGNFSCVDEKTGEVLTGERAIAYALGMSTSQLRITERYYKHQRKAELYDKAKELRESGMTYVDIAEELGFPNESTVRSLLNNEAIEAKLNTAETVAAYLENQVDTKGVLDVGKGVQDYLGISDAQLKEALYIMELDGYEKLGGRVSQVTNDNKMTTLLLMGPPGTPASAAYDVENIHQIDEIENYISNAQGDVQTRVFQYPESLDSSRLMIRYAEDGGTDSDGLIELRPGVKDISLGNDRHSQVRILVDDTHYLKGMAVYSDNLPPGVDVLFNTNKSKDIPALGEKDNTVLKLIKNDPDNPFGSLIKEAGGQSFYIDENGEKKLSLINKTKEEGDVAEWKDSLPSQFVSKQSISLAEKQLGLARDLADSEFNDILALSNPTVKKKFLLDYAESCDEAASHLAAAALPRQSYKVILPLKDISDGEVYAPTYKDGEQVALIRYPHGGRFEIPILTVNNKITEGKKMIGPDSIDAIGINHNVANRLSGADFDGDTVMIIPTNKNGVNIKSAPTLKGLENFDPSIYQIKPGDTTTPRMKRTDLEMGKISNLITDMTLAGASNDELARAVKHSMVVIDAEKHGYDYKKSEKDNDIRGLKEKYQGRYNAGASTIISKASREVDVPERKDGYYKINPETGEKIARETGRTYTQVYDKESKKWVSAYEDKNGSLYFKKNGEKRTVTSDMKVQVKQATSKVTEMDKTNDARTLMSKNAWPMEKVYADYANHMKTLANEARKAAVATKGSSYDPKAKERYSTEVSSLNAKLNLALKNAPLERSAQLLANTIINAKKRDNPNLSKKDIKKLSQQALVEARNKVGAKRHPIDISDREWEAIQAGAITKTKLEKIMLYADDKKLKQLATPKKNGSIDIPEAKIQRMKAMKDRGYTTEQIASALGYSTSTISEYTKDMR